MQDTSASAQNAARNPSASINIPAMNGPIVLDAECPNEHQTDADAHHAGGNISEHMALCWPPVGGYS
jgi:hypothetical protein